MASNEFLGFARNAHGQPQAFTVTITDGYHPCPDCHMTGMAMDGDGLCTKCLGTGLWPVVSVTDFDSGCNPFGRKDGDA